MKKMNNYLKGIVSIIVISILTFIFYNICKLFDRYIKKRRLKKGKYEENEI